MGRRTQSSFGPPSLTATAEEHTRRHNSAGYASVLRFSPSQCALSAGVVYRGQVRHLFLLIVLGILAMDATGLAALVSVETCTGVQDSQPDGTCPALCVRCACCAQPIVANVVMAVVSMSVPQAVVEQILPSVARTAPAEIFHVPKFASSTI
jgi:hypothetical protein